MRCCADSTSHAGSGSGARRHRPRAPSGRRAAQARQFGRYGRRPVGPEPAAAALRRESRRRESAGRRALRVRGRRAVAALPPPRRARAGVRRRRRQRGGRFVRDGRVRRRRRSVPRRDGRRALRAHRVLGARARLPHRRRERASKARAPRVSERTRRARRAPAGRRLEAAATAVPRQAALAGVRGAAPARGAQVGEHHCRAVPLGRGDGAQLLGLSARRAPGRDHARVRLLPRPALPGYRGPR
mmetsp:Transcript_26355/g.82052  ORF Transcript_26355/g.82052 Transcript_26355/m.82052 type:complete len:243 (+) Transcript_26355:1515-2243(+)